MGVCLTKLALFPTHTHAEIYPNNHSDNDDDGPSPSSPSSPTNANNTNATRTTPSNSPKSPSPLPPASRKITLVPLNASSTSSAYFAAGDGEVRPRTAVQGTSRLPSSATGMFVRGVVVGKAEDGSGEVDGKGGEQGRMQMKTHGRKRSGGVGEADRPTYEELGLEGKRDQDSDSEVDVAMRKV